MFVFMEFVNRKKQSRKQNAYTERKALEDFASFSGKVFIPFNDFLESRNIPPPKGSNPDGVLEDKKGCHTFVEHTRYVQHGINPILTKEYCYGLDVQRPKNPKLVSLFEPVQAKHEKSEGYLRLAEDLGCSLKGVLLVERPIDSSSHYSPRDFEDEICLYKDSILLKRKGKDSFFKQIYYGATFQSEPGQPFLLHFGLISG